MSDVYASINFPGQELLAVNPVPILMQAAPLAIRFQVLRDLLGQEGSEDYSSLQRNLRKQQARRKLMNEQGGQGLWPLPGDFHQLSEEQRETLQFIHQLEVLNTLLDLMVTQKQEKVRQGMEAVLAYLERPSESLRMHHLVHAIYLATVFQLDSRPVIKQLIWTLLKRQNVDGGWTSLEGESASCIWTSLFFLWTLGQGDHSQANRTIQKGLEYLEASLLRPDQSQLIPGMQAWDTLISGTQGLAVLGGGTLRYLEMIQLLNPEELPRKSRKLLKWLTDIQLKNGLWPAIAHRDKKGDFGVTLRVLKVLKHFQLRRQKTVASSEFD